MKRAGICLAGLVLTGCAHTTPVVAPPEVADDGCHAARAGMFVGQPIVTDLAEMARKASGAKAVRTIRPGTMVTMDYRADRLNLTVNGAGVVTAIRCG